MTRGDHMWFSRVMCGLTRRELAEKSGLSERVIYRLENGETTGSVDMLLRLSKALGISLDDYLGDVKSEEPHEKSLPVTVYIPLDVDESEDPNLFIGINGVNWLLPKGKTLQLPQEVAEEYFRSCRAKEAREKSKMEMRGMKHGNN